MKLEVNCRFIWAIEDFTVSTFDLASGANFDITTTDSGYQTQQSFEAYTKGSLTTQLDENEIQRDKDHPIFWFLDGHKSHYSFMFLEWCRANFIHVILFFPNATRILQMCDVVMFSPGKQVFASEVQRWRIQNPAKVFDEVPFISVLQKTNERFIKAESIRKGFEVTGIFPLNVENVRFNRCIGTTPAQPVDESPADVSPNRPLNASLNSGDPIRNNSLDGPQKFHDDLSEMEHRLTDISKYFEEQSRRDVSLVLGDISKQLTYVKNSLQLAGDPTCTTTSSNAASTSVAQVQTLTRSVSEVLVAPEQFSRATKIRAYKGTNYGVMTSNTYIEACRRIDGEKKQAEIEKEMRKNVRSIKKEQAGEKKEKSKKSQKNPPDEYHSEDTEWQPSKRSRRSV